MSGNQIKTLSDCRCVAIDKQRKSSTTRKHRSLPIKELIMIEKTTAENKEKPNSQNINTDR